MSRDLSHPLPAPAHVSPHRHGTLLGPLLGVALILFAVALRPSPAPARIRIETQNPATAEALSLATLPGSGLPLAHRTVLFRDQIAPLDPPDRMRGIPGLGTRRLHEWSRWIEIP